MSELTDRLVEAAAREIYSDWAGGGAVPLESSALHHRYGTAAQAALAVVLPLLADEIEARQSDALSATTPVGGWMLAAALIREATP